MRNRDKGPMPDGYPSKNLPTGDRCQNQNYLYTEMPTLKNKQKYLAYLCALGIFAIALGMILGALFSKEQPSSNTALEPSPLPAIEESVPLPEEEELLLYEEATPDAPTKERALMLQRQGILEIFKGGQEPPTKDALWDGNTLVVFIDNNGTRPKDYAERVCGRLKAYGMVEGVVAVEVNDYADLINGDSQVRRKLGLASCGQVEPLFEESASDQTEVVTDQHIENGLMLSRSDFGEEWPLVVESGILKCEPVALRPEWSVVTFESQGITYAVNGLARGAQAEKNGWSDIEEIRKDDPERQGYKTNIGTFIDRGLEICNQ